MKTWLRGAVVVGTAALMTAACATGVVPEDDASNSSSGAGAGVPNGPLPGYAYRQQLTLSDAVPLVAISFELDHAQLVADGKAEADGRDVRVTYESASGEVTQLDRTLDPFSGWNTATSKLWLRTPAVEDGTGSYYVYYGNASASAPPADGTKVHDLWDDFEDGEVDAAWLFDGLTGATGSISESDGAMRVTATAQDFADPSDQIGLATRDWTGDFRMEAVFRATGGSLAALAKAGGLTVRQSVNPSAGHATIAIQHTPAKWVRLFRAGDGLTTENEDVDAPAEFPHSVRIDRTGNNAAAAYRDASGSWLALGSVANFTMPLTDPVRVGVPIGNRSGGDGWADVEWIRINRIVAPAPSAAPSGTEDSY